MDWPKYFRDRCALGNLDSNVAVLTLWTPMAAVQRLLDPTRYAILSQLYSKDVGLNAVVRGCLANPNIRYLVICGQDLSKSGEALINLKQQGIDTHRNIIGSTNAQIDQEIPETAIAQWRAAVEIIDCRTTPFTELPARIAALQKLPPYGEPQEFPEAKVELPDTLPAERAGFTVRAKTIGDAWLQLLQLIMRFGAKKESQRGEPQKELMDLMVVVTDENPDAIAWKPYFNFTQGDLERYYPQVLEPNAVDTVKYTYGSRLMQYKGKDQIAAMIAELKDAQHSRRAVAVLWNVEEDPNTEDPPCFNLLQALVQNGKLTLTAYIRSNDMYDAWPRNAFALRKLQQKIANGAGCAMGDLVTISASAHIYQRSLRQVAELLKDYPIAQHISYDLPGQLMQDPRGNVLITLVEGGIKLVHCAPDGKPLEEAQVHNAKEAMQWLQWGKLSDFYHAMYLGRELEKAETALKRGIPYVQDQALKF